MTINQIIKQLDTNQEVFKNLLIHKTKEEYLWRPQQGKWCLLEIVCHLLDEEDEDFKTRVTCVLKNPLKELPKINPGGWVLERDYISQDYEQKVTDFINERKKSIVWLNSLENVNWENAYIHPKRGTMSAKLFLANWLAHDYLHIRQIIRYQYHYLKEQTGIDLQYAGNW